MHRDVAAPAREQAYRPRTGVPYLPSVAVLPFRTTHDGIMSGYFADGVTIDIIASLGSVPDLLVIAAATMLRYRDPNVAPRQAGAEVGARYVLTGDIERHDQRLAFRQRLVDVASGELLWTDFVEANLDDLHGLQHYIVARVVNGIVPHVGDAEIDRAMLKPPANLTAYDLVLRALPAMRRLDRGGLEDSRQLLSGARQSDPRFARAFALGARIHSLRIGQGWAANREVESARAMRLARTAIALDPDNSVALATAAHLHSFLYREYDRALELFGRAIEACHNDPVAWSLSSATLSYVSRPIEALRRAEHAIRLSPMDHSIHQLYLFVGIGHFGNGDYDAAEAWTRRALAENPKYTASLKFLIASLVGQGRIGEAREIARELRRLEPCFAATGGRFIPFADPLLRQRYIQQLRTGGALDPGPEGCGPIE